MKIILDTSIIIELMKPSPSQKILDFFQNKQMEVFSSVFTFAEISRKISNLPGSNKKKNLELWLIKFLEDFQNQIFPIDFECALYYESNLKHAASVNKNLQFSLFMNLSLSYSKKIPLAVYISNPLPSFPDLTVLNLYEY